MFDIGMTELLVVGVVALIVVGPKDLPGMFRTVGRFTGKARGMAKEFQRAMNDAADEAGVADVAKDLKNVTSKKNLGLDALEDAAKKFEDWNPKSNSSAAAKPGVKTAEFTPERAEKAEKIHKAMANKATERHAKEAAEAAKADVADPTVKTATKAPAKKAPAKKAVVKKVPVEKTAAKKPAAPKATPKTVTKTTPVKKAAAPKPTTKAPAAKKTAAKKAAKKADPKT
ncbi:Sec-independent protein translocase protein TatB [Falsihalocynthiibacter sp. S25ZX9]|uniref:Sec-independent protein translocase protein TatB n=1 Tax=Falsihalocynthiibacter sp. S25ZX9 TaxID=3240870 RepID=UPI00350EC6AC